MEWSEVFQKIESNEFAITLNIASTFKVFLSILQEEPIFIELSRLIRETANGSNKVIMRIKSLTTLQIDYRYEHPYDSAFAAYAWALAKGDVKLARVAAEMIINTQQTWWARNIGAFILEETPGTSADPEFDNVEITETNIRTDFPSLVIKYRKTSQSVVLSSIYPESFNNIFQGKIHNRNLIIMNNFKDFFWTQQLSLWRESSDTFLYMNKQLSSIETFVEWNQ